MDKRLKAKVDEAVGLVSTFKAEAAEADWEFFMGGVAVTLPLPQRGKVSAVWHDFSYGRDSGLWEVALIGADGDFPHDPEGWLTVAEVKTFARAAFDGTDPFDALEAARPSEEDDE